MRRSGLPFPVVVFASDRWHNVDVRPSCDMGEAMRHSVLCVLSCAVVFASQTAMGTEPLVCERFEGSVTGSIEGGVTFDADVVGWGGLVEPNRSSGSFDGQAGTGVNHGLEKRVQSTDFTVEAMIKVAQRSGYAAIAADWSEQGENRSWAFVLTPRGGLRFDVSPDGHFHGGNKLETTSRLIEPGRWYHVAAVSHGSASRIFINGRQVAQRDRAVPGIFSDDQANLKIGNIDHFATTGPRPWHGSLDEVRITLKSLAPDEFVRTRQAMPRTLGPVPERYIMPFTATTQKDAIAWQQQARHRLMELVE